MFTVNVSTFDRTPFLSVQECRNFILAETTGKFLCGLHQLQLLLKWYIICRYFHASPLCLVAWLTPLSHSCEREYGIGIRQIPCILTLVKLLQEDHDKTLSGADEDNWSD